MDSPVGFSNGWAEFALKNPPPLLPSSLIASWDAIGPIDRVWWAPWRVVTVVGAFEVSGTPCQTRMTAATMLIGSRMYRTPRVRSTQKLPRVEALRRTRPRTRAIATARPIAAEMNIWTTSPPAWARLLVAVSPE